MKKFAIIQKGRVHSIEEFEELPPFHPSIEIVEITHLPQIPKEGWGYNGVDFTDSSLLLTIEETRDAKIVTTKYVAKLRILSLIDSDLHNYQDKEANILARSQELLEKKIDGTLTQVETDELATIKNIWDSIKNIRTASNSIENELNSLETVEDICLYDTDINPLWP